ncbi:nitroreductase family protein [Intestinibacillus massiliensis]|uniref:nitroreductase family protein n=1 Tax=Intestinibacillus massiliensis TaxID=1871029 RepID=UPI000B356672|nr:nitroreductase [Intestinibacillus massiliensis]
MNTADCILSRRSVRAFQDKPVPHALFEEIVGLAAYAPSWKNTQITRYIAIEDKAMIAEIAEKYAPFNAHVLSTCPLLVAATVIKKRSGYERDGSFTTDRGDGWQMFDCGIACQTLSLAAHDNGLGAVIMGVFDRPALEKYLAVPDDRELVALVAMGYPAEEPAAPRRKPVEELLSWR